MSALCADCRTLTTALDAAATALEHAAADLTIDEENPIEIVESYEQPIAVVRLSVDGLEDAATAATQAARAARSALAQGGGAMVGQWEPKTGQGKGGHG